jgi:hypothetical protein
VSRQAGRQECKTDWLVGGKAGMKEVGYGWMDGWEERWITLNTKPEYSKQIGNFLD